MNTPRVTGRRLLATLALPVALSPLAFAQTTGFIQTGAGPYDYNTAANWADSDGTAGASSGDINGVWDASLTLAVNQTVTFATDTTLTTGLDFEYTGGFNVTLTGTGGAKTLTLGGDITVNTASTTRTINLGSSTASANLNVDLGGSTRIFTVGSGRTLGFVNTLSNGAITTYGGTVNFSGTNTYTGATNVNSGTLSLNGTAGSSALSDFTVNGGGSSTSTLTFNSGTNGNTGTTRAQSVTLNGTGTSTGTFLTVSGNGTANSNEVITNALTASEGYSIVSLSANAAKNAQLTAGSFVRQAGSTILFRGTNLGINSIASLTAGSANISFTGTPSLIGSGSAGSSTVGILKGSYGASTSGGSGSGLVTYDSTYGVRLLNTSTEYTAAISNGQTTADNILYARASGGASQDINLTATTTTVNSLSFNITGTGTNSGVTISGDAGTTLKIDSGMIFASQSVTTAAATDAMLISTPTLDLNGQEGVIIAFTSGVSNGNTLAPLQINSVITNDGGNGVTIGGTGQVIFGGSTASTYTGPTTLNSGILRLNKSVSNIGLTSDLVINGGILLKTTNAIADTASVTINGGSFVMDNTTSSGNNGHQETLNNFTMNGGSFSNHGSSASFTVNGNATLTASELGMNQGGDITVLGTTNLSGGVLRAKESTSTSAFNALTSLNTLAITNTASSAYMAVILQSHATNKGAQLTLNGDVTFTGNGTNANTVKIASSDNSLANQGVFRLEGTRTFTIGNGAASSDLTIETALVDATTAGGLVKTGAGTLALTNTNTYTGGTTVNQGVLLLGVANSLASSGTITLGGGTLGTGGFNQTLGTLTVSASSTIDLGSGASALSFADSSATIWAGSVSLSFINFDEGTDSIRFGTTTGGVTGTQLGQITINGLAASIDANGFLSVSAVPEPSTFAAIAGAGALLLAGFRRRTRRA